MWVRGGQWGPPGSGTAGLGCGREGSACRAAAAQPPHRTQLAEQVCVPARSAPGPSPVGRQRRGAALPSACVHLTPGRSERTHATFAGLPQAQKDGNEVARNAFPRHSFCLPPTPPRLIFHLREELRRRAEEEAGLRFPRCSLYSHRRFLTARPFFSLFFLSFPIAPQAESGAEPRGETWLVGIVGREPLVSPLGCSPDREEAAKARDPGRPGPAGLTSTPSAPAPCTHPV